MLLALRIGVALLLVVAVLAAATLWRVAQRRAAAERTHPPQGEFIEVKGHPVHYVQRGEGPDVVLIHGASGNTRDMTSSLVGPLSDRYRVTVFDRPGLGHTPALKPGGVTLSEQTALLVSAARALGITRPIVAGQSFGGALALNWAVHHPGDIAAAVSIAGATHPWPGELDRLYATLARPVIGPVLAHLIAGWVPRDYVRGQVREVFAPQDAPDGYVDEIGIGLILRPASIRANAQQRTDLRADLRAQARHYPDLSLPIEIVHGTADDTVGLDIHARALAEDAKGADLTTLDGVGHMPHHVATGEVVDAIDRAARRAGLR